MRLDGILIDATDDKGGAEFLREGADALEFLFAVFEVDGVDDALTLAIGEREFDGARIGGIDHNGRFDFADELFVEEGDVVELIAIARLEADIDDVGAVADLAAGNFGSLFPFFFRDEVFEEAGADDVGAFADDERAGGIFGFDDIDAGEIRAMGGRF